jgi:uncharacterized protein YjiS (DUF1127 family)
MTGSVPAIAQSAFSQRNQSVTVGCAVPRTMRKALAAKWAHLQFAMRIARERRMLASLDDAALKDIGLNRGDVEREISRSPMDLPRRRSPFG